MLAEVLMSKSCVDDNYKKIIGYKFGNDMTVLAYVGRDKNSNYACKICGKKGGRLNVHHLNGWKWDVKGRYDSNNIIVLCKKCHELYHKVNGRGNNTKKEFIGYVYYKIMNGDL